MAVKELPPIPKGSILSGNLREIMQQGRSFYVKQAQKYSGVFRFRVLNFTSYVITKPEYIETILVTNRRNFIKGRSWNIMRRFAGNGLLTSEGDFWLRQRRFTQPAFHHERLEEYGKVMADYTNRMLDTWETGQTRDVFLDMKQLTLEIVCRTLFNADIACESNYIGEIVEKTVSDFDILSRKRFPLPKFFPTSTNLRFKNSLKQLNRNINGIILNHKTDGKDQGDLLSMLIQVRDDEGMGMNEKQLRDEVLTLLMAGHETTAVALTWALYLLAKNPEIEAKLIIELQEVLNGREPKIADLPALSFTEKVIKETLRLYPSFWITVRDVKEECEIGGFRVPAGARVCLMPWVVHRNPDYYENPEQFLPDRWTEQLKKSLPRFAYFPFGGGPRQCIGNGFAMMEAVLVLASIVQRFHLAPLTSTQVEVAGNVVVRPKQSIRMKIANRNEILTL